MSVIGEYRLQCVSVVRLLFLIMRAVTLQSRCYNIEGSEYL